MDEITTLTTRIAYENRWLRVREDTIRRQDGSDGLYGVVERTDFAIVVPWGDGCLTLVEQYRYPVRRRLWELPMGMWEGGPDALALAEAELREETGLRAGRLEKVGEVLQGPGYCNQLGHVVLATDLTPGPPEREATEQGMVSRAFPLAAVEAMIRDGTLVDGMTIAAIGLLRVKRII